MTPRYLTNWMAYVHNSALYPPDPPEDPDPEGSDEDPPVYDEYDDPDYSPSDWAEYDDDATSQ